MARPTARPGVQQESREEILRAAAIAFMERGFAATSIDDVADLLGATKGRVYHYYRSKADLFFDVLEAALRLMLDRVAPIAARDLPPAEKLHAMAYEHAVIIMTNFPFEKVAVQGLEKHLMSSGNIRQHRLMRRVIKLRDEYENLFADVIKAGVRAGAFRDLPPRLATKPVLGALNWLTIWFDPRRAASPEQIDTIAGTMASFVTNGMRRDVP